MHSLEDIEKSQKQYAEAKAYFMSLNLPDCVIEILDVPMSEWPIHLTPTEDEMAEKIREYNSGMRPYIYIYKDFDGVYFLYMDFVTKTREHISEGKIVSSDVVDLDDFKPVNMDEVMKEFAQLVKMLQGR